MQKLLIGCLLVISLNACAMLSVLRTSAARPALQMAYIKTSAHNQAVLQQGLELDALHTARKKSIFARDMCAGISAVAFGGALVPSAATLSTVHLLHDGNWLEYALMGTYVGLPVSIASALVALSHHGYLAYLRVQEDSVGNRVELSEKSK